MTETPQSERILVTGATGRLGRLLRPAWAQAPDCGVQPVYAARQAPADIVLEGTRATSPLPQCRAVIALWGCTSGTSADLAANVALAAASRALAQRCGADRVLHFSSAAVYGPGEAMDETRPPAPVNAYGASKLAMEDSVAQFQDDNLRHCCLRLANVVGADSLAEALGGDRPATLDRFTDGTGPVRSYICPGDLARVLAGLVGLPADRLPAVLNVAAPDPVGMADLLGDHLVRRALRGARACHAPDRAADGLAAGHGLA